MIYPLVRELAVDGIPVTVTCRVLKIARQPYYRWLGQPYTTSERLAAQRTNALVDAHRDDPCFGYRLLADEAAQAGFAMARRTVWRLCQAAGITGAAGRRRRGNRARPSMTISSSAASLPAGQTSSG